MSKTLRKTKHKTVYIEKYEACAAEIDKIGPLLRVKHQSIGILNGMLRLPNKRRRARAQVGPFVNEKGGSITRLELGKLVEEATCNCPKCYFIVADVFTVKQPENN